MKEPEPDTPLPPASFLPPSHGPTVGQQFLLKPGKPVSRKNPHLTDNWEAPSWERTYIPGDPRVNEEANQVGRRALFQHIADRGHPAIRFPEHAVGGLEYHKRFLSQHVVGDTRGEYDPEGRRDVEKHLFGTGRQAKHRPIYGYMDKPGDTVSQEDVDNYGELKAVLKPSVRERTTLTWGDSLEGSTKPISHADAAAGRFERGHTFSGGNNPGYIEAQYHGGLPTSDIEHLELHEPTGQSWRSEELDPEKGKAIAASLGTQWRHLAPEEYVQQQLPHAGPKAAELDHTAEWQMKYKAGMSTRPHDTRTPEQQQDLESGRHWAPHQAFSRVTRQYREVGRSPGFRSAWPHPDWE